MQALMMKPDAQESSAIDMCHINLVRVAHTPSSVTLLILHDTNRRALAFCQIISRSALMLLSIIKLELELKQFSDTPWPIYWSMKAIQ